MRRHLNYRGKAEADEDFVDWAVGSQPKLRDTGVVACRPMVVS